MIDNNLEILPVQNDNPELVFIFGAGASYPDGIPVQSEIIPIILGDDDLQITKSEPGQQIRSFLHENFSATEKLPTLEEVFGFIDFHINNDLSLSSRWTTSELIKLKSNLTKVLHYVISSKTRASSNFQKFWNAIRDHSNEIAVITTNYDTLIDEAFNTVFDHYLIDYCIDLINFRYPANTTSYDGWINPRQPVKKNGSHVPVRTKLIKLHGSLNWKYCNCCAQVGLTPRQHRINLKTDSFESFHESDLTVCPFDQNKLTSLIQVPSHIKTNHNFIFNKLYDEAGYTIRGAKRLVFIGYSFPEADVHIRALIKRHFKQEHEIIVINKSSAKDLIHRYATLSSQVNYKEMTFESFLKSRLFKGILKENKNT